MSHHVVSLVEKKRLGSTARKAVMIYCARRADDDGSGIWSSKATIAAACELGRRVVIKIMQEFVAEGLLAPSGRRACANGHTVEYDIDLAAIERLQDVDRCTGSTRAPRAPVHDEHPTSAPRAPVLVHPVHPTSAPGAPESSLNDPRKLPGKGRARASPLDPDWTPSQQNIADAEERGFTRQEIEHEAHQFREHHLAAGSVRADWGAAWRKWLGDARQFAARPAGGGGARGMVAALRARGAHVP
jgi:hypothetical protein